MAHVVLNVFSTFEIGGPQVRFAAIANLSGHRFRQLVFAIDDRYECFDRLQPGAAIVASGINFPRSGTAANIVAAYNALRHLRPKLLVTYNWGAIDGPSPRPSPI